MGGVFINNNNINNFSYAIFPLSMLYDDSYKEFSSNEYFLYTLLLNRMNISKRNPNHFSDEKGIFVYYSNHQICENLKCNPKTATKVLNKLEQAGLIRKEYQKRGLPLKIYVKDIRTENESTCNSPSQKPQDKLSGKPYSDSNKQQKPFRNDLTKQEKPVSFDVERAEKMAKMGLVPFSVKKEKRRTKNKDSTM